MEAYFEKLLETRGALECALVYLAAQKATPEDGKKRQQPLSYAIARDVDYGLERDFDFHLAIADIADNDFLRPSIRRCTSSRASASWRLGVKEGRMSMSCNCRVVLPRKVLAWR